MLMNQKRNVLIEQSESTLLRLINWKVRLDIRPRILEIAVALQIRY